MVLENSKDYREQPDGELMNRCLHGDDRAWGGLIDRYGSLIYSVAWKCHLPSEDVADVFQSVCLMLMEDMEKLKNSADLTAWLTTITLQQCRHLVELDQVEDELSSASQGSPLPDAEIEQIVQEWLALNTGMGKDQGEPSSGDRPGAGSRKIAAPSEWLIDQVMNLFAWHKTRPRGSAVKQIPAFLLVDSFEEGQLMGFRSVGPMPRQMLYRAGDYHLNLSINKVEPAGPTITIDIMGQPLPLGADLEAVVEADVELLAGPVATRATKANQFGAFILDGVREGTYELRIRLKGEEIYIPKLEAIVSSQRKPAVN